MLKRPLSFVFCLAVFFSCDKFEYNVYETGRHEHHLEVTTAYNLQRILALPAKDTLKLAVFGDTQRFYRDTEDLVNSINDIPGLDAVIITGDLSDFGVSWEFDQINEQFMRLKVPFLTVVGNHDYLGNGTQLYQDIYGPLNYAFTWNDVRFIFHNNNSREVGFNSTVPDLNWIRQQTADTAAYAAAVFVSHVPSFDSDFDPAKEYEYVDVMHKTKNTILSIQGHKHNYDLNRHYNENIWFLFPGNPRNRIFSIVTLYPYAQSENKFDCTPVHF